MIVQRSICIGALVPVLAFGACGGDDTDGEDDFATQVDAVCIEGAERINAAFTEGAPTSAEEAAALGAKLVDSRQQEVDELEALEPPEDLAAGYEDFVAARKEVLAGQQSQQAADEQADQGARERADAYIAEAFVAADEAAEGIGLEACAGILPAEEEDEVSAVTEQFFGAATAEELKVPCNELATDAYIESIGGLEQCLAPGEPRTIEISDVSGVSGVSAEVIFAQTGGSAGGQNLRANLVYQDGEWLVDALSQAPPPAEAEGQGGGKSARGAYNQAVDDLAPAIDVLFIQMDQDSDDLEALQADAAMLRDAFFNFDAKIREISFPASLEDPVNSLLEANGTVIADLDAIGEATDPSEAGKLVERAVNDFEALHEPASAVLSQGL